jgi:CPA2 family monovalent cation:H+ antiporter-2
VVSTLGVVLVSWAVMSMLGASAAPALLLSMGIGISSTAVFVRVGTARREIQTVHGRVGLGISIAQDVLTVAMLALVPALSRWAAGEGAGATGLGLDSWARELPLWAALPALAGKALGGVTLMVVIGRYILPRIFNWVSRQNSGEMLLVVAMAIALSAALGTKLLGFSAEMGAFLGGLLLASTPYRYQISGLIAPLRDLLMAVFFTAVGLSVDPSVAIANWPLVVGGVLVAVAAKSLMVSGVAWGFGVAPPSALLTGVYLANAGEFTIVIGSVAYAAGGLTADQAGILVAIVILSLIVSSVLFVPVHGWAERMSRWPMSPWSRPGRFDHSLDGSVSANIRERGPHVVLAGYGPVGRALADSLARREIPFVVIELNPRTVERQSSLGREFVYGDVTNPEVLESAGVHEAYAAVVTIPDDEAALRACGVLRSMASGIYIAVRTTFLSGAFRAKALGADREVADELSSRHEVAKRSRP